ncbi:MAG: PAS domain S-box protein [Rhodospirillaceae bacterium]|nr:MAG: PAS domain S-box protein [Rhodospirillaceae bacterium]
MLRREQFSDAIKPSARARPELRAVVLMFVASAVYILFSSWGIAQIVHDQPALTVWESANQIVLFMFAGSFAIGRIKRDSAALESALGQVHHLVENMSDAFFAVNNRDEFTFVNRHFAASFDRRPEELIGGSVWDWVAADAAPQLADLTQRARATGEAQRAEVFWPPHETWYEFNIYPHDSGLTAFYQEVTRRRQAEEALRRKTEQEAALAEFAIGALRSEDFQTSMQAAMSAASRILRGDHGSASMVDVATGQVHILAEQGILRSPRAQWAIADFPENSLMRFLFGAEQVVRFSDINNDPRFAPGPLVSSLGAKSGIVVRTPVGANRFYMLAVFSIRSMIFSEEDVRFLRAMASILTSHQERERAIERLLLQERVLDVITQGVNIVDNRRAGYPIIYANPAFAAMTGYSQDEIPGRNPYSFFPPDMTVTIASMVKQAAAERRPLRLETELIRKDGTVFLDRMVVSRISDSNGNFSHLVAVHEDVTEARRQDERLREAQKMESVGQLTGGIAHDFNNLLTAILIHTEKLREKFKTNADVSRQADIIIRAAERGESLVRQLLAFARKQELNPKTVDVNELISSFADLLRRALPAHIVLDVRMAERLPPVKVDPGRLESAILNLALNARDAMPDGGTLTIETEVRKLDEHDGFMSAQLHEGLPVVLTVTDTGIGMPREVVDRAFEPFFTTKEIGKGTGLGLSMVYGFVKQSGGHTKITSVPRQGTSVRIFLPAVVTELPLELDDSAPAVDVDASRGRILLVEDEELLRMTVGEQLLDLGYSVVVATTASEAIDTLEQGLHFDLVFSDVIMPGEMNGVELAREIQRRWPEIKVLLTSGYAEDVALSQIKLLSGVKLLAKPYRTAVLAQAISETLGGETTSPQPKPLSIPYFDDEQAAAHRWKH